MAAACGHDGAAGRGGDVVGPAVAVSGWRRSAWPGWPAARAGIAAWSDDQHPGAVAAGQAPAGQVAQVQRGGAALEPGVILGHSAVAELEPASPPGGDLGDRAFHVGPVGHVVLAQPGDGPVTAGGAQQVITLVQDELAAGLAGRALLAQRAVPAQRPEGGDAGAAQDGGVPGRAGDRALLFADGEVVDGEPALDGGAQRLRLDHRLVPGLLYRIAQVTGAVSGVAVPGQRVTATAVVTAAAAAGSGGCAGAVTGGPGGQ